MKIQLTPHVILRISLIIKAVDAALEVVGGLLLLMPIKLDSWIEALCRHELAIGKHAALVMKIQELAASSLATVTIAAALYLLVHGGLKLLFITAAMREKLWGYAGLILFLSLFTALELLHFAVHGSTLVLVLAVFDGLIVYLAAKEYSAAVKRRALHSEMT